MDKLLVQVFICIALGYFIGGISPSYAIGRIKGYDVRSNGSGNAGATNTMLIAGKLAGVFVAVVDILKAVLSWKLCAALFPQLAQASMLGGTACVLGHMFPLFLGFKGGKGFACLGGLVIAYSFKAVLVILTVLIVVGAISNYLCIAACALALSWPLYFGYSSGDWLGAAILLIPFIPVVIKHMENFRRIPQDKELRLSYLWNKEAELLRTGYEEIVTKK